MSWPSALGSNHLLQRKQCLCKRSTLAYFRLAQFGPIVPNLDDVTTRLILLAMFLGRVRELSCAVHSLWDTSQSVLAQSIVQSTFTGLY